MEILFLLIPLGILLVTVGAGTLVWAVSTGQYDQLDEIGRHMPDEDC